MSMTKKWMTAALALAAAGTALAQGAPAAGGEAYPSRVVRLVVPFAAGASSDILGRILAERLTQKFKQPFIVENKAGAGGTIGTGFVAKAAPDGYTLLVTTSSPLTINPLIDKAVTYDVKKDLTAVAALNKIGLLLVSHPDFPAATLPELVELARRSPGKYSFATNGAGSYSHMSMELFKKELGLDLIHVPYKGAAQAETDVMGGQVTLMFDSVVTGTEFVKAGRMKSFGISSRTPDPLAPAQKPLAEQSLPQLRNFDVTALTGLLAPAGTPPRVIDSLQAAVAEIVADPGLRAQMMQRNIPLATPQEVPTLARQLEAEHGKWSELVRVANIRLE